MCGGKCIFHSHCASLAKTDRLLVGAPVHTTRCTISSRGLGDFFVGANMRKGKKACKVCLQCCRGVRIRQNGPEREMSVACKGHCGIWHRMFCQHTWLMGTFDNGNRNANGRWLARYQSPNAQFWGQSAHVKLELAAVLCCLRNAATISCTSKPQPWGIAIEFGQTRCGGTFPSWNI